MIINQYKNTARNAAVHNRDTKQCSNIITIQIIVMNKMKDIRM